MSNQHDFILLDRSGSMSHNWEETLTAVNAYVNTLVQEEVETKVTFATFDGQGGKCLFDVLRAGVAPTDWKNVTSADASPRGWTPLSDAIGKLVALANTENYDKVAIIIMTDGVETGSTLTVQQAKQLLQECRDKNWQVIFLGADFNNTEQAASYGNAQNSTVQVSTLNLAAAMTGTAQLRGAYGSGAAQSMAYSDEQRRSWGRGGNGGGAPSGGGNASGGGGSSNP